MIYLGAASFGFGEILRGEDAILREGRLIVFTDIIRMIRANPFGVGIVQYQNRIREYQTIHPELLLDQAHNDYLNYWLRPFA